MGRKKLETEEDFFNYEPQKSLLNILIFAPDFDNIYEKGLEPKELRELIVKDYTIQRIDDEKRYALLQEFKNFLSIYKNKEVALDQNTIRPGRYTKKKGRTTSTTIYDLFNKTLRNIIDKDWIKNKNGLYTIDKKHKLRYNFARMKQWHKDVIDNSNKNRIFANTKIMFYFMNDIDINHNMFSDFELYSIDKYTARIVEEIKAIDKIFKKVSRKKANQIWKKFISNFKCSYPIKLLIWINFIGESLAKELMFESFKLNNDVSNQIKQRAKKNCKEAIDFFELNGEDKTVYEKFVIAQYDAFILQETRYFFINDLILPASFSYLHTHYPDQFHNKTVFSINAIKSKQLANFMTLLVADIEKGYAKYLMIFEEPFFLSNINNESEKLHIKTKALEDCKNLNDTEKLFKNNKVNILQEDKVNKIKKKLLMNIKQDSPLDHIVTAYGYTQDYSLSFPKKPERENNKSTFFTDSLFLNGFENVIEKLGVDRKELYERLDEYATFFDMPTKKS